MEQCRQQGPPAPIHLLAAPTCQLDLRPLRMTVVFHWAHLPQGLVRSFEVVCPLPCPRGLGWPNQRDGYTLTDIEEQRNSNTAAEVKFCKAKASLSS